MLADPGSGGDLVSAPDTTGDRPCGCRSGTADRCARCAVAPELRAVVAAPVDERVELRAEVARLKAHLDAVCAERDAALESARTIRAAVLREHALDQLDQALAQMDASLAILRAQ